MNNPRIQIVQTVIVKSKEELMKIHSYNISQGYEGTIVRHGDDGYKLNGRSSSLLKLKDFEDITLTLMDVIPSEKRPTHGKPIFFWEGATDNRLGAGLSIPHDEAEDLLINKSSHIGKTCEIRFFEYSDTGVPRHPVMHGFRLDK
jgi:ATP-dependent DNA ligase